MIVFRILGEPARVFYRDPSDLAWIGGLGAPHALLTAVDPLESGTSGVASNMTIRLDNSSGRCVDLFRLPPLDAPAELRDEDRILFAGVVNDIAIDGDTCTLSIESGLSRPLPLRMSTVWGGFREAEPLPHRYGYAAGRLIQYNASRTVFVWADHACEGIDEVLVEGQTAGEWQWRVMPDSTGHVVTVVEFGQPQDEGAELLARGRGKLHPSPPTRRMSNPAEVVWDVLANLGGWNVPESALDAFRRRCDVLGLEVGGSIESAESAQSIARAICASVGASFCPDATEICALLDGESPSVARTRLRSGPLTSTSDRASLCNDLTVEFGFENGNATGSVRLEAPDYIARFGRRSETLQATWVVSPRVAVAVGERALRASARPSWSIRASVTARNPPQVFDGVAVEHPGAPVSGTFAVRSRRVSFDADRVEFTLSAPAGDPPSITLAHQSSIFRPGQYVGATAVAVGTDRVYTITEADGSPIAGASVTANGFTRTTDSAGRVAFPLAALPPGSYVFRIVTTDGRSWTWPTVVT